MHRFHLPPATCQGSPLTIEGGEAHHALHVVRVRPGDRVTVLDGAGLELACTVGTTTRHAVVLEVHERLPHPAPVTRITLFQAVTKARSMEWVIQKATELGCHRIVPVVLTRSVPHYESTAGDRKSARWLEHAIEAMKQCGWPWLPEIPAPVSLADALARWPTRNPADPLPLDLAWVASLHPGAVHPRQTLDAFHARSGGPPHDVGVWIGPEGDFTPAELERIIEAGACPVSLGPQVLRSETAAIYCLSVLNYELLPAAAPPRAWASSQSHAGGRT